MGKRTVILLAAVTLIMLTACTTRERGVMNLEQSVCGLKEPIVFWLWSSMAGHADAGRVAGLANVEDIAFETQDGRTLRGYRLRAHDAQGQPVPPSGYLLIMQGNAILADQITGAFHSLAAGGLDVYVYDYRGYGRSSGRRRLKAIISDYVELLAELDAGDYAQHYVYAMSFGGIVLLNGLAAQPRLDRLIVDSSPARLSDHGCPPAYDPVRHLPDDCRHCLFITGERDQVVGDAMSRELVQTAASHGATLLRDPQFAHPFMDRDPGVHRRRLQIIENYLLYNKKP